MKKLFSLCMATLLAMSMNAKTVATVEKLWSGDALGWSTSNTRQWSGYGEYVYWADKAATAIVGTKDGVKVDTVIVNEKIDGTAPIFAVVAENDGSITGQVIGNLTVDSTGKKLEGVETSEFENGTTVFVDFYVVKKAADVTELQIEAGTFAGSYYVEASTLFRRQDTGVDMPAEITIPNAKIQSNFTFSMASTGDPSTFSFTMDALPGYTLFDNTKKVLCVIQVIDENNANTADIESVMAHDATDAATKDLNDSVKNL